MDKEKRDSLIRIAALSGIAFLAVVAITGFENHKPTASVEKESIDQYIDVLAGFNTQVASLQKTFDTEPMEVDWVQLEALEKQKIIEVVIVKEPAIESESPELEEAPPEQTFEQRLASLTLTGIAWSDRAPLAFVGNQVLRIGDSFAEFTVANISPDSVELIDAHDKKGHIHLYESAVRP